MIMKNINSKSFKQYTAGNNKRAVSPLLANTNQASLSNPKSSKKKPAIINSPYQRAIKQFQSYGKAQRKKISNYVDAELSNQKHNKFRIVTQPVDDRIMHLAQSNIFNSSLGIKNPKRIQSQIRTSNPQMHLNIKQNQHNSHSKSRERIYTNPNTIHHQDNSGQKSDKNRSKNRHPQALEINCRNCIKYAQQLQYMYSQIKNIIKSKQSWKNGQITYQQVSQVYRNIGNTNSNKPHQNLHNISVQKLAHSPQQNNNKINNKIGVRLSTGSTGSRKYQTHPHNSLQNLHKFATNVPIMSKYSDTILFQIKSTIMDLILEVQALASIDYPKMLQMQIFKHQPTYSQYIDVQENQLKDLFGQLRMSIEGKTIDYDTYDSDSQNTYTKMIMRNMKSRLNAVLRQNLQLKVCKAIYEKSQQISQQSQEYLRRVIEDVLQNYVTKKKIKQKEKQKQKQGKQKGKSTSKR